MHTLTTAPLSVTWQPSHPNTMRYSASETHTPTRETDAQLTYSSNFTQATSGPAQAPVLAAFLQSNAPHVLQSVNTTHQRELESKVRAAAPLQTWRVVTHSPRPQISAAHAEIDAARSKVAELQASTKVSSQSRHTTPPTAHCSHPHTEHNSAQRRRWRRHSQSSWTPPRSARSLAQRWTPSVGEYSACTAKRQRLKHGLTSWNRS